MLPFLALLLLTLAWLLLPLLPALRELLRPTDVAALKVVDRSAGYVAYFARNFRQYLERQLGALPAAATSGSPEGVLPDGTRFVRMGPSMPRVTPPDGAAEGRLVIVESSTTLPDRETYLMELYARTPVIGGTDSVYRAVYADRELGLGERSVVLRWAHAGGTLGVGSHSVLRGRTTSDKGVVLGGNVVFERIGAPVISVGTEPRAPVTDPLPQKPFVFAAGTRRVGDHQRIQGNLEIPDGSLVTMSLVVAGTLTLGAGAVIDGSVKAHGDIEMGDGARILGSAIARRRIMLGSHCWIGGPAIAEDRIRIGRDSVIGGPELPATVSAPEVELLGGATIYGQISAPVGGRTF